MYSWFLSVRVLHVLLGGIWLGTAFFLSFLLMPALREIGPEGGKVVLALGRRKLHVFIAVVSGLTVLSGLWLYWRFTVGFDPAMSASMGGRVFGLGGLFGLVAAIIGGSVVGRNMKSMQAVLMQIERMEPAGRSAMMEKALRHRQKAATGGRIVAVLLILTIVLMAMGHYV